MSPHEFPPEGGEPPTDFPSRDPFLTILHEFEYTRLGREEIIGS
jgi:hypothetical protein